MGNTPLLINPNLILAALKEARKGNAYIKNDLDAAFVKTSFGDNTTLKKRS